MVRRSTEGASVALAEFSAAIAERAYFKAEQRGFAPGQELDDWLAAEREVAEIAAGAPAAAPKSRAARRKTAAIKKLE